MKRNRYLGTLALRHSPPFVHVECCRAVLSVACLLDTDHRREPLPQCAALTLVVVAVTIATDQMWETRPSRLCTQDQTRGQDL